jgi:GTP-binding protein Era
VSSSSPSTPRPARTGLVAIIGRPNVGKSTLLNALIGARVSITSRKPQTTRQRIVGVLTRGAAPATTQFVFIDTPGLQDKYRSALTRHMNEEVAAALADVDAIVLVIEARGWTAEDERLLELLARHRGSDGRVVLAINKTDLLARRDALLPLLADSAKRFDFAAMVPVSAEKERQLDDLLNAVERLLPEGEPLFDAEQLTDRNLRFLAAEFVREKAFRLLGDELPYGVAVTVDQWTEDERHADIAVTLWVEREPHKGIVIGADGGKLREIGRLARKEIAELLGKPVHLQTWVRVRRGWTADERALKGFGLG